MKVAVIGSRGLQVAHLEAYLPEDVTEIVSGGARGIRTFWMMTERPMQRSSRRPSTAGRISPRAKRRRFRKQTVQANSSLPWNRSFWQKSWQIRRWQPF